jgi:UDP-glucose 4-epimerase
VRDTENCPIEQPSIQIRPGGEAHPPNRWWVPALSTPPPILPALLVTGATGFIGRAFLRVCQQRQWPVVALTRRAPSPEDAAMTGVQWLVAELDQVPPAALASCGTLVHLAAAGVTGPENDWELCFGVNVTRSMALWRSAIQAGIGRFIICGSCFEYGRAAERYERIPVDAPLEPVTAYAASKAAATALAQGLAAMHGLRLTVVRPFQVYGPGEAPNRFWPSLQAAALAGRDFPMTAGLQVRDFIPVAAAAEEIANHVMAAPPAPGQPVIHHIGTGRGLTVLEFAESEWRRLRAKGRLLPGAVSMRPREVLRYVPELTRR